MERVMSSLPTAEMIISGTRLACCQNKPHSRRKRRYARDDEIEIRDNIFKSIFWQKSKGIRDY